MSVTVEIEFDSKDDAYDVADELKLAANGSVDPQWDEVLYEVAGQIEREADTY